jgi:hypothetical protein
MSEPNMCSPAQMKYTPQIGGETNFRGVTANLDRSPAIQYSLSDWCKYPLRATATTKPTGPGLASLGAATHQMMTRIFGNDH